ncbi:MAG: hypothetical protein LUE14_12425 [Clostridiales bacterium]|nr:hypothetical protein [Clostridiales bacterium]
MRENYYAFFLAISKGYSQKQAFKVLNGRADGRKHRKKPEKFVQEKLDLQQVEEPA